jgi:tripartite-type tricarboxylate transporter receptor subunit TctC
MRIFRNPGYDALKDFRHVIRVTKSEVALVVAADSDIKTLDDLLARLKARPGKVDYASGGIGTPSHLGMEQLLAATGMQALNVPYKGASEIVNAVLGKQVTFGMPIFSVAYPFVQGGKLRALAVSGHARNPALPQVPTLAELGVKGIELTSWGGVSVPAGTPDAVVQRMGDAFVQALKNRNWSPGWSSRAARFR